ncbi:MAG: flagellar protein FlaG [Nitrospirae bacterium]|nr:flagellar protein FlaG [Nitrospirota bacterium]MCL5978942.1 flagellar protein FlaG [Nitrospirota bacterium]
MEISGVINTIQGTAQGAGAQPAANSLQPTPNAAPEAPEQINMDIGSAVEKANDIAQLFYNTELNFRIDDTTKQIIVRVVDGKSGEVIRQIPPEEMVRLVAHFDKIQALLFSKKY